MKKPSGLIGNFTRQSPPEYRPVTMLTACLLDTLGPNRHNEVGGSIAYLDRNPNHLKSPLFLLVNWHHLVEAYSNDPKIHLANSKIELDEWGSKLPMVESWYGHHAHILRRVRWVFLILSPSI
jgi:hypothetical protein